MPKKVRLGEEKVLDSWSVLVENAQGKSEEVYNATTRSIQESKVPDVKFETVKVKPYKDVAIFRLWGEERELLMITSERLKDYRMYIGARDYGNNLDISWYLTCQPRFFKSILSSALTKDSRGLSFTLDIFEHQDLTAYVTNVHHCLLKAVENLMRGLNQDPSKIERKSRGFLGVS